MAAKKVYAVKRGKVTGVFYTWEECRDAVEGYPRAEYRGFSTPEEAQEYLQTPVQTGRTKAGDPEGELSEPTETGRSERELSENQERERPKGELREQPERERPAAGWLLAYVDGSYEDSLKKYAFGCVFLLPDGHIYVQCGSGDREESLQHRNVTGEMLGAMYAVKVAMVNGYRGVEVCYDYQGIEKWVTGEWRSKTELTGKYAAAMRDWGRAIEIKFRKVTAHSNVRYNELADRQAKRGLRESSGIPKAGRLEEMEEYCEA